MTAKDIAEISKPEPWEVASRWAGPPLTIGKTRQAVLDHGLSLVRGSYQRSSDKGRYPRDQVQAQMARFDRRLALTDCDLVIIPKTMFG